MGCTVLSGCIHTCDFLNYCVNLKVQEWGQESWQRHIFKGLFQAKTFFDISRCPVWTSSWISWEVIWKQLCTGAGILDVCVCFCVKLLEWVLWQQMMVFILNVYICQQRSTKNVNADVKCEHGLSVILDQVMINTIKLWTGPLIFRSHLSQPNFLA